MPPLTVVVPVKLPSPTKVRMPAPAFSRLPEPLTRSRRWESAAVERERAGVDGDRPGEVIRADDRRAIGDREPAGAVLGDAGRAGDFSKADE